MKAIHNGGLEDSYYMFGDMKLTVQSQYKVFFKDGNSSIFTWEKKKHTWSGRGNGWPAYSYILTSKFKGIDGNMIPVVIDGLEIERIETLTEYTPKDKMTNEKKIEVLSDLLAVFEKHGLEIEGAPLDDSCEMYIYSNGNYEESINFVRPDISARYISEQRKKLINLQL